MSQIDVELAALLSSFSSLSFDHPVPHTHAGFASSDVQMNDDDRGYQSDSTDTSSSSVGRSRPSSSRSPCPCAILQDFACYHGTSVDAAQAIGDAELSQLVFMHRAAFLECPSAHAGCSASFTGLASLFEKRLEQPAGGSLGSMDAVGMLRTEAWYLSGWSS
ncbi:hypothetical protein BGY98DRAFT_964835 [Russula aff. rugulosa BPL654]|nr:hypothetical protein BGY98DRAFT_964835 [Russula aff. rugulosa BPL654]